MNKLDWNYFMCNECFVMFPHLTVPEICVCGNDMRANSTRRKFILKHRIEEIIDDIKDWSNDRGWGNKIKREIKFAILGDKQ